MCKLRFTAVTARGDLILITGAIYDHSLKTNLCFLMKDWTHKPKTNQK